MSDFSNDPAEQASAVSAALTEQMLHLSNRFQEERLKLEERTFQPSAEDAGEPEEGWAASSPSRPASDPERRGFTVAGRGLRSR